MESERLRVVTIGLSITSSWGNGHATTYRSLLRAMNARGHELLFLERDVPWYASRRDLVRPAFARVELYRSLPELKRRFTREIRTADVVIVGSYVPEGIEVGNWVVRTAKGLRVFYDIDTPITLAQMENDDVEYLSRELVRQYDLYLSFTGGPTLHKLEAEYGSPQARALYCSADIEKYFPEQCDKKWDMGYLGTYSSDRQEKLHDFLIEAARVWRDARMAVAGPLYPDDIEWPGNIERVEHLPPAEHRGFYNHQRFSLNITRAQMARAGYSPSVRLFEAAACGAAIISDYWEGLETFFEIGTEILLTSSMAETLRFLRELSEGERQAVGQRARARILSGHTAEHRAMQLEGYLYESRLYTDDRRSRFHQNFAAFPAERKRVSRKMMMPQAGGV
ncbi:MAG TPA: glycosyltransferase [Terriglobia bacterium]|nr:glycosyltransferase [Terriglobia bacterium]